MIRILTQRKDGFRPESIDDTKTAELVRDESSSSRSAGGFQLRSQSTEVCPSPDDDYCTQVLETN